MKLEELAKRKCASCGNSFSCDVSCGNPLRNCWCVDCFRESLNRAVTEGLFHICRINDRFKCSLLSQEEKEKLMLLLLTGKVIVVEEDEGN